MTPAIKVTSARKTAPQSLNTPPLSTLTPIIRVPKMNAKQIYEIAPKVRLSLILFNHSCSLCLRRLFSDIRPRRFNLSLLSTLIINEHFDSFWKSNISYPIKGLRNKTNLKICYSKKRKLRPCLKQLSKNFCKKHFWGSLI